ncbi:DNA repair protein [Babesia ovis]|uniref:DNA repair protein n=1 Tax=Babesia ovis TaxID=5869 RepID=A0A9W5TBL0_BABOV|nr:DNA repair protein [Babesia ovis]
MKDSSAYKDNSTGSTVVYYNCLYDRVTGEWMAPETIKSFAAARQASICQYKCVLRKSKRSISKCSKCNEEIKTNEVVVGLPLKDVRGPYGYISTWYHLTCGLSIYKQLLDNDINAKEAITQTKSDSHTKSSRKPNITKQASNNRGGIKRGDTSNEVYDVDDTDPCEKSQDKNNRRIHKKSKNDTNADIENALPGQFLEHAFVYRDLSITHLKQIKHMLDKVSQEQDADQVVMLNAIGAPDIPAKLEPVEQPRELLVPLLPFQRDGVAWMLQQERETIRGGILADEMGMGKTIQTIGLLLAAKAQKMQHGQSDKHYQKSDINNQSSVSQESGITYKPEVQRKAKKTKSTTKASTTSKINVRGGTLIVSPLAALLQWYNEIKSKVDEGYLSVLLYHGPHRKDLVDVINNYDVVLTTYSIVETEFRKVQNKNKVTCQYCGRMYLQKTLILHQKYFCGPFAQRTMKQSLSERKRDVPDLMIIRHARLFPEIKQAIDEANETVDAQAPEDTRVKRRKLEIAEPEQALADYYSNKRLKLEILDAFTEYGLEEKDVENVLHHLDDINSFMEKIKAISEKALNTQMDKLEILARFAESETLDMELFKSTTVVVLKDMLSCFGLNPFGRKAELINKVIVFINKLRQYGRNLARYSKEDIRSNSEIGVQAGDKMVSDEGIQGQNMGLQMRISKAHIIEDNIREDNYTAQINYTKDATPADGIESTDDELPKGRKKLKLLKHSNHENIKLTHVKQEKIDTNEMHQSVEQSEHRSLGPVSIKTEPVTTQIRYKPLHKEDAKCKKEQLEAQVKTEEERIYEGSVLHEILWERIVVDEAHRIKTKSNSTSQAILALRSSGSRWCLTGTPLQNRVGDVFSLISFLKMYPYAYNFCNKQGCRCESTEVRCQDYKYCDYCGHSKVLHYSYFNKRVLKPILNCGYSNEGKVAMKILHKDILARSMLRRTKVQKAEDVKLPPMSVTIRKDSLSDFERDFYEAIYKQSSVKFDTYANAGTLLHNYAHIFDLLTRLRQAVDHPYLILYGPSSLARKALNASDPRTKAELEATVSQTLPAAGTEQTCALCFETLDDMDEFLTSNCTHHFHQHCLGSYIESRPTDTIEEENKGVTCPTCYAPLTIKMKQDMDKRGVEPKRDGNNGRRKNSILQHFKLSEFKSSTKIEALLEEISEILTTTADKSIVFSQYCSMLELIAYRLKTANIQCAILVGSTSLEARRNMLLEFNNSPNLRVMLIGLNAGGEGLNLQVANRIFLMDPWWNPASELQAIQRAHRIGQTKPVYAVRFICKDTIEERIIKLQEKKMILFDATISSSAESMTKLTSEDLSFLFSK